MKGGSLIRTPLGQISVLNSEVSLISEVVKYTNVAYGTDESVLFMEVSSIQWCPDREVPLYRIILFSAELFNLRY